MFINLEEKEIKFILGNNCIGYLGYIYKDKPFIVPITYYFNKDKNTIIFYSGEGHKINAMRKNNAISLQVASINSVTNWKSVLVHGTFKQLVGSIAKAYLHKFSLGIKEVIMEQEHKTANFISEFSSIIYNDDNPIVFIMKIKEFTGKKRHTFNA